MDVCVGSPSALKTENRMKISPHPINCSETSLPFFCILNKSNYMSDLTWSTHSLENGPGRRYIHAEDTSRSKGRPGKNVLRARTFWRLVINPTGTRTGRGLGKNSLPHLVFLLLEHKNYCSVLQTHKLLLCPFTRTVSTQILNGLSVCLAGCVGVGMWPSFVCACRSICVHTCVYACVCFHVHYRC